MKIKELIKTTQKPEIYTPGTASMWEDEHISTHLLEVHLNQNTDLASRKESTISSTIDWMLDKVPGDTVVGVPARSIHTRTESEEGRS